MKTVKHYESFNQRRYGNPWVAKLGADGKPDFANKIGGYTGRYNAGEAGDLYITTPEDGAVYIYGQKDYRNEKYTERCYVVYKKNEFTEISRAEALRIVVG